MSITLEAKLRENKGKGASRRLKKSGEVPAIIYGGKKDAVSLSINSNTIEHLLEDESVYTSILDVNIDGKAEQGILKDIQRHPAKNIITHIDLQRVDAKTAITTRIPLSFVGSENNKYIRLGAVVNQFISMVEVKCLPKDLPTLIEVDISNLKVGEGMRFTDLNIGEGVMITALNHKDVDAYNQTVVSVSAARKMAEIVEDEVPVAAEGDEAATEKPAE
jgi:large subunit ribosomal protein L25